MFNYEKLEVVQIAYRLVDFVYRVIKHFPKTEEFGLSSQLRRAVISIILNIAEGSGRYSKKEFARYIRNSIGSLLEVDACLKIAVRLGYVGKKESEESRIIIEELFYKLVALEKSLIGKRERD